LQFRAYPEPIHAFVPMPYSGLGTGGCDCSDILRRQSLSVRFGALKTHIPPNAQKLRTQAMRMHF
jgi:hypothetical protein